MSENPKTLEAIDKIRAILVEYDLWGCLTVVDTERTHWMYRLDPSWSCVAFEPTTGKVSIRAMRADFATKEGHHYVVNQTTGAIFASRDAGALLFSQMDMIAKVVEKHVTVDHIPFQDLIFKKPSS